MHGERGTTDGKNVVAEKGKAWAVGQEEYAKRRVDVDLPYLATAPNPAPTPVPARDDEAGTVRKGQVAVYEEIETQNEARRGFRLGLRVSLLEYHGKSDKN